MRIKRLFLRFLLLCGSIVFTFLLLEILLRMLPIDSNLYDQKLIWNHWETPRMPEAYNELYVYNDVLGFERKEINERIEDVLKNNPLSYKILILGDSITQWGKYVEYFEDLLVKRYNNIPIEIVNAGVMGYDTELEHRYLRYRGLSLDPDLVIVQFCVNDFKGTPVIIKQKNGSWLALDGAKKISKWINPKLFATSKAYAFVMVRLLDFSKRKKEFKNNVKEPLYKIKQLLEEKKIPFYFVLFPRLDKSYYTKLEYYTIKDVVEELNLELNTIDLLPFYSRVPFESIRKDGIHPNEQGDKIAAVALIEKLSPLLDKQLKMFFVKE